MSQIFFLCVIIAFFFTRKVLLNLNRTSANYLLVSFFIVCIPFEFGASIIKKVLSNTGGTLGTTINLTIPVMLSAALLPFFRWGRINFAFRLKDWTTVILILILVSFVNPYNYSKYNTIVFTFVFYSHILFFRLLLKNLSRNEIIKGLYDGLLILSVLQLILSICFPVLGMSSVTKIFREGADEWATRLGTRNGAVGVFNSPGNLAFFSMIAAAVFFSCVLKGYYKKTSLIILVFNLVTIILTYSRTTYIVVVIDLFAMYYIYKNAHKNLFTFINILKFVVPAILLLGWLVYFSPLSSNFLESDSSRQVDNRLIHWAMAFNAFSVSPVIGVGLNAHLLFFANNLVLVNMVTLDEFFLKNPIHNIHLIVLVETGSIGLVLWLMFIFKNIFRAKDQIMNKQNEILSLSLIGVLIGYLLYGMTGWSPFASGILPFFLFITFFAIKFRDVRN